MICGTIWGYDWDGVRAYAHSLLASGYKGKKVLFVYNMAPNALGALKRTGFELIPWSPSNKDLHPITARWEPILKYFEKNRIPDRLLITDVNDCVFQSNPFDHPIMENGGIIGATESILVGEEATHNGWSDNFRWCVAAVGRERAEEVADQEVLCHGTFAGHGVTLCNYIREMYDTLRQHPNPRLIDQGLGQWLLRKNYSQFLNVPRPKEGFILSGNFCWNSGMDPAPSVRAGIAYPLGSGTPFSIVHLTRHHRLHSVTARHWFKEWNGICKRCGGTRHRPGMYGPRCQDCGNHHVR